MSDTLVLNSDGSPISLVPLSVIDWKEAVTILYLNKNQVLHFYSEWRVHSPSTTLSVPSVILLKKYVNVRNVVRFNRSNIFLRDEYICQYCGNRFDRKELTLDHVRPVAEGGKKNWRNIVASCLPCNSEKAHYHDMQPINPPRIPTYYELLEKRKNLPILVSHPSWIQYLDWSPDKIKVKNYYK